MLAGRNLAKEFRNLNLLTVFLPEKPTTFLNEGFEQLRCKLARELERLPRVNAVHIAQVVVNPFDSH